MRPELLQSAMSPARSATWVPGAITRIASESEPVRPALLVTDTRTLSRPSAEYAWLAVIGAAELDVLPVLELPSPHRITASHAYSALDRKSTRLNSSHTVISYAVFCLKKKN